MEIDSVVLRKIEELREILEEEEGKMENKAAKRHAPAELRSYKSGIAVIKSNFNIEPGTLVGEYRNGGVIELGFIRIHRSQNVLMCHAGSRGLHHGK
ncbi:MAG: hypothetical protein J7L07_02775 [Candidatus Odinarchaeota archaeon]|nr:hypothetical protein [Candidatus Odinarchaeota archaeon]